MPDVSDTDLLAWIAQAFRDRHHDNPDIRTGARQACRYYIAALRARAGDRA